MDCCMALHKSFFFYMKLDLNICVIVCLAQFGFCCMWFCSSLVWTVALDSPFTVSPSSCELAPLKSTSFRVTYDPKQLNTLDGAQLECFAYYKVLLLIYSKNSFTSSDGASLFWINISKNMSIWNSAEAYSHATSFAATLCFSGCCRTIIT